MIVVKKIVSGFLMPLPFAVILLMAGLVLLWFTSRQRAGKALVTLGACVLMLVSLDVVSNAVMAPLEAPHPASSQAVAGFTGDAVVVLGGGHSGDRRFPVLDQLSDSSIRRLVSGQLLARQLDLRLILSGGAVYGGSSEGQVLRAAALTLGFPEGRIDVEDQSRDTIEQAVNLRKLLGTESFLLVSDAAHLTRATRIFRHYGLNPVPVASHHFNQTSRAPLALRLLPSPESASRSRRALHEYLGSIWFWLRYELV